MERIQVSDVAQIYKLWKVYSVAVTAGDMERWISLWIEAGVQMPPEAPRRVGKETIRLGMQPQFDLFDWQMAIYPDEVRVMGDHAYSHGSCEFVRTPKEGGNTIEGKGKFLTILQRQIDGSWKIAVDCFNYSGSQKS
jgi:uncharacterized protein (TIGR02246 family)